MCFEKEEDAEKMKSVKGFDVKGLTINVVREEVFLFLSFPGKHTHNHLSAVVWSGCQLSH